MTMVRLQVSSCENDKYIHIDDILLTLNEIITNDKTSYSCKTIYTEKRQFLRAPLVQLYG